MSGDRVFRRVWTRALLFFILGGIHIEWTKEIKGEGEEGEKKGKKTRERRARLLQLQCTSQWWQTTMTMRTKTTTTLSLVRMDGHFDFSSLFTRVHVVDDDLFPPHISLDKKPSPFGGWRIFWHSHLWHPRHKTNRCAIHFGETVSIPNPSAFQRKTQKYLKTSRLM